ncbi:hypothetical protein CPC08DRAFT_720206 [Agrocybe pediades]|nr:hypothetical protein CPC08DRAFT_720206 [Agrocybe pediades]
MFIRIAVLGNSLQPLGSALNKGCEEGILVGHERRGTVKGRRVKGVTSRRPADRVVQYAYSEKYRKAAQLLTGIGSAENEAEAELRADGRKKAGQPLNQMFDYVTKLSHHSSNTLTADAAATTCQILSIQLASSIFAYVHYTPRLPNLPFNMVKKQNPNNWKSAVALFNTRT